MTPETAAPEGNHYNLRLYVAGQTARTQAAISNLARICREHLEGRYSVEVIDLLESPDCARDEEIVAVPLLVSDLPPPIMRLIGDLSDTERVLASLAIDSERPHSTDFGAGDLSSRDYDVYLRQLIERDDLTGLLNRRAFECRLLTLENRFGSGAVLLVDVDQFKMVNDRFGHPKGDRLLKQIGYGLAAALREDDVIARLGGDEFAILMRTDDWEAVNALASRLVGTIRSLQLGDILELGSHLTISVGGALITPGVDVMESADSALYRAKRQGRDRAVVASN